MFSMGVCVGGLNCFSSIRFFATLWIIAGEAPTSEISQARKLEWVSMPSSRGSSQPRDWTLCLLGLLHWQVESLAPAPLSVCSEVVTQSCPTLCDPMDCTLQGSSVHGIFQAQVLEWVDISFSRGSSPPRDQTRVSCIAGSSFTVWATREYVLSIKQICQNQKQRQLSKNTFEIRKHFLSSSKMGTIYQTFACTILVYLVSLLHP